MFPRLSERSKAPGERPQAPEGYQSKLGGFFISTNTPKARPAGKPAQGYQSKLGAFGTGNRPPAPPKRRGGNNQRH